MFKLFMRLMEDEPGTGGGGPTPTPKPKTETFSAEYVHELREENKTWRLNAKAESDKRIAAETTAQTATEAAKNADKAAQAAADERVIRVELKAAAREAGIVDVSDLSLIDVKSLKIDKDGEVTGVAELIEKLKTDKPYLFKDATTTSTTKKPGTENAQLPKKAKDMSPEELKAEKKRLGIR